MAQIAIPSEQFDDLAQQKEASTLGMWVFLATEAMLFGGMMLAYTVYRTEYPEAFRHAVRQTNYLIGTTNTFVLLASSVTMALAVLAAERGSRRPVIAYLFFTLLLGATFLGLKGLEYFDDYRGNLVPHVNLPMNTPVGLHEALFFMLYYFMTGLHAIHLTIGCCLVIAMIVLAYKDRFSPDQYRGVDLTGLYWHFVDIIWIFLYPMLYLIGRS